MPLKEHSVKGTTLVLTIKLSPIPKNFGGVYPNPEGNLVIEMSASILQIYNNIWHIVGAL